MQQTHTKDADAGKGKSIRSIKCIQEVVLCSETLLQGPLLDLKLSDLRVFAIIQNAEERTLYAAEKRDVLIGWKMESES